MTLRELMDVFPRSGVVEWIGVRPGRGEPMRKQAALSAYPRGGITGDRYDGESGKRHVTLIQAEHLEAVASFLGLDAPVDPNLVRRNIVVRGINLLTLKGRRFQVGRAVLEHTGSCHPCLNMEAALGEGGYNAMRQHGGITARVVTGGMIKRGDAVIALTPVEPQIPEE